jgi:enamine deaminase RidA (YjgF/YER057c/UK114 family)
VYRTLFPDGRWPARTCVGVTALARGCEIEIDVVAKRRESG